MAVVAELRVVAAIVAGRNDLIHGSYSDGCGNLVSGDKRARTACAQDEEEAEDEKERRRRSQRK